MTHSDSDDAFESGRRAGMPGDAEDSEQGIEIDPGDLSTDALRGLVEEFVSREGTDYGHADRSLEGKVADVHRQLASGEARIVFDLASESASIVTTQSLRGRESL